MGLPCASCWVGLLLLFAPFEVPRNHGPQWAVDGTRVVLHAQLHQCCSVSTASISCHPHVLTYAAPKVFMLDAPPLLTVSVCMPLHVIPTRGVQPRTILVRDASGAEGVQRDAHSHCGGCNCMAHDASRAWQPILVHCCCAGKVTAKVAMQEALPILRMPGIPAKPPSASQSIRHPYVPTVVKQFTHAQPGDPTSQPVDVAISAFAAAADDSDSR
jgi:hypothetical protein